MLAACTIDRDEAVVATCATAEPDAVRTTHMTLPALTAFHQHERPRWVCDVTAVTVTGLARLGCVIEKNYDVSLVERILLGRCGIFGSPLQAAAVVARATGAAVPADPEPAAMGADEQLGLFGQRTAAATEPATVLAAYFDQQRRMEQDVATGDGGGVAGRMPGVAVPLGALRLLVAAESGSALVAAEMTRRGLPWDVDIHDAILRQALGPRPAWGQRPERMAELAAAISAAFGFPVNPDSPQELREAFVRSGFDIESTRSAVVRGIEHPAAAPLLHYKDLARLFHANGWHWIDQWVRDGRLASEYLPGAVVSGRWATRGGGGLQLPKVLRRAARAQPGYQLVVADAAQLEPRVLAAVSRDRALLAAAGAGDLYMALAADGFGGDRAHAKLAMLGAMYGQTSGEAARLMAVLRQRYPRAINLVETAAQRGETGKVVASVLGRAAPPPAEQWRALIGAAEGGVHARRAARDRGRFTRNFVIQASAADWAAVWMTLLRLELLALGSGAPSSEPVPEIVLFQHDELVVHAPEAVAEPVADLMRQTAAHATALVFPDTGVHIPVHPQIVACYADAT